jgi:type VI secretion system protein ImpH
MNFSEYQRMLPGGGSIRHLYTWLKNYVGYELTWELQLILRASEIPSMCLGKIGQLGWSTWLGSKTHEEDADDLVLGTLVA